MRARATRASERNGMVLRKRDRHERMPKTHAECGGHG